MKIKFRTKAGAAAFTLLIVWGVLTGCTEKDLYKPDLGKPELKSEKRKSVQPSFLLIYFSTFVAT